MTSGEDEPGKPPALSATDLTDEILEGAIVDEQVHVVPYEERTRRTLMVVLGGGLVVLFLMQIGFALFLSPEKYQAVGAALTTACTLIAGYLGNLIGHYSPNR